MGTESAEGALTWAILAKAQLQDQLPLTGEKQALALLKMLAPSGSAHRAFLPRFDGWVQEQREFSARLAEGTSQNEAEWTCSSKKD